MSLEITSHFSYDPVIGAYDFTQETGSIQKLREITNYKELQVYNTPLTILAYREYGDHTLWWVLATYNNIIEVDEFSATMIKVPDLEEVRGALQ